MTEGSHNILVDELFADENIPDGYRYAQKALDNFVEINYETATDATLLHTGGKGLDTNHIKQQIVDIIRNNPPLQSVPFYFRDGREDYLWYSDFYDDSGREVFQQYRTFVAPVTKITASNYAVELEKIDLPYFKELVNLISLERLGAEVEHRLAAFEDKVVQPESGEPEPPAEKSKPKRSYEPKLSKEQYSLLAGCIEKIELFRRPVSAAQLKRLLTGKSNRPLQVNNQPSFVCLFDKMMDAGYIKDTWMSVAVGNQDFTSFRRGKNIERYGNEPHYLNMSQLTSRRDDNNYKYVRYTKVTLTE